MGSPTTLAFLGRADPRWRLGWIGLSPHSWEPEETLRCWLGRETRALRARGTFRARAANFGRSGNRHWVHALLGHLWYGRTIVNDTGYWYTSRRAALLPYHQLDREDRSRESSGSIPHHTSQLSIHRDCRPGRGRHRGFAPSRDYQWMRTSLLLLSKRIPPAPASVDRCPMDRFCRPSPAPLFPIQLRSVTVSPPRDNRQPRPSN